MLALVATDGTDAAIEATRKAMALLRPEAEVVLVTVIAEYEDPMEDAGGIEGPGITDKQAEQDWQDALSRGQKALERTGSVLRDRAEVKLIADDRGAGPGLIDAAKELGADLIVVGSNDKHLFRRLVSGSVSDYMVHHAPCPILVVPRRTPPS